MRVPTDMPKKRRGSGRGRIIIIVVLAVAFLLITSLRGVAGFWTDFLWFDSLGLSSVFSGILGARIALGAIFTGVFFLLTFVSLTVADRIAPKHRPVGPEDDLLTRYHAVVDRRATLVRAVVSLVLGLIAGVGMSSEWNQWILFRNGGSFGVDDQTFQTDVGFYVFKLPFYITIVNWLFASGVIILLATIVAHYLNGGIRLQAPVQRVTPQVKAHISVILGLLALVKAADYWLQRFALTWSTRGTVDGATYTDVKAQLPAIYLLLFIALLSFGLFIYNIWRRGWVLPVVAVGLWALVSIVAGVAYPAFIQRFRVEPEESSQEAPYIQHNIEATRAALGLTDVKTEEFGYTDDQAETSAAIDENPGTVRNIRLLDPARVTQTFQSQQNDLGFYRIQDLDVDRYPVTEAGSTSGAQTTQVVIGARDLFTNGIPQQSWEGRHLAYTHGYGLALAPANTSNASGSPDYLVGGVPVNVAEDQFDVQIDQPQLYYGEDLPGYAITNTGRAEVDYTGTAEGQGQSFYEGTGGVPLDSFVRKAAFALRFADWNLIVSNFLTGDSRIVFERDIRARIEKVAPFLDWDADPYPVVQDGRVVYLWDGYTTTDHYPNAQRADTTGLTTGSGLSGGQLNYVRNSVKAVLDTYDGTVKLYVVDPDDPIVEAYQNAFPDLFFPVEEMPEELREHWRYPEDMFRLQTNMYGRYHITDPQNFYERTSAWAVATDPGTTVAGNSAANPTATQTPTGQILPVTANRIDPFYQLLQLPGENEESFVMSRPFVPFSALQGGTRQLLTSFMVADSDPDSYGEITVYEMPEGAAVNGPLLANTQVQQNPKVSFITTQLNQQGSRVEYGNMLLVPLDNSILYVRPLYVSSDSNPAPALKAVIVVYGNEVAVELTLREALLALFPDSDPQTAEKLVGSLPEYSGDDGTAPDQGDTPGTTTTTTPGTPGTPDTTVPPAGEDATVDQLMALALQSLDEADAALLRGDLAGYQAKVDEAQGYLERARDLIVAGEPTPSATPETTVPSTIDPTTTTTVAGTPA
jgi:uncharacterized membrane protein (UPF0182 family)